MIHHMIITLKGRIPANSLILTEIIISFLVLFTVCAFFLSAWNKYTRPLGFDYRNMWEVSYVQPQKKVSLKAFMLAIDQIRDHPQVEALEILSATPFDGMTLGTTLRTSFDGPDLSTRFNQASDGAAEMLDIRMLEGRWFSSDDDGLEEDPVVINRRVAQFFFGDESPIGKTFVFEGDKPKRVIGLIEDFRDLGEFGDPWNYMFMRIAWNEFEDNSFTSSFQVKLKKAYKPDQRLLPFFFQSFKHLTNTIHGGSTPYYQVLSFRF